MRRDEKRREGKKATGRSVSHSDPFEEMGASTRASNAVLCTTYSLYVRTYHLSQADRPVGRCLFCLCLLLVWLWW